MPIINVEGVGKVEFPDSMNRAQIDAAIRNEILPALARAQTSAASAPPAAHAPTPFSKGTAYADTNWKVGDRYRYRVIDLLTKVESTESRGGTVTAVTDAEVVYGNGRRVTDLLGNVLKNPNGQTFTGSQIFVDEYRVGRRWTTTYRGTRKDLQPEDWSFDFKVVTREPVTVPAGTFDTFKVEGEGYSKAAGVHYVWTYWMAPEKVRPFIVFERMQRHIRSNRYGQTERIELAQYKQS